MSGEAEKNQERLSDPGQWEDAARPKAQESLPFDPRRPGFRDVHRFLEDNLPKGNARVLEVGCYPGRYLWYFSQVFAYEVCGLEYVPALAIAARQNLRESGVSNGEVVEGDFFSDEAFSEIGEFDLVYSYGFVEHFEDTEHVLQRHLSCLKPGGLAAIVVPNHSGIYGRIMKWADRERFEMHNCMDYAQFAENLPTEIPCEVVAGGYLGRFGFWNCWLYQRAATWGKLGYLLVRAPCWLLESVGRLLPNSKTLSPEIGIILRRLP